MCIIVLKLTQFTVGDMMTKHLNNHIITITIHNTVTVL